MIFARKGETVTCQNDHEIATLAEDLYRGDIVHVSSFTNWREGQMKGQKGQIVPPCWCGKLYIGTRENGGTAIHFKDGWRPKLPPRAP